MDRQDSLDKRHRCLDRLIDDCRAVSRPKQEIATLGQRSDLAT